MSKTFEKINGYYEKFDEWERLSSASGILEKITILKIVADYIPAASHIFDLGSGPGRYAMEFVRMGHRVTLADLSSRFIEQAKRKFANANLAAEQYLVANATSLGDVGDEAYDAIFCSGPFYHLIDHNDRYNAAQEMIRICRKGGWILTGFIPKFSALNGLIGRANRHPSQIDASTFLEAATTGAFHNRREFGFQEGFFSEVEEFKAFWAELGLHGIEVFSTRSFMHQQEELVLSLAQKNPKLYQAILDTHFSLMNRTAYIDGGGHAVLVGQK